ncbi:MAG: response regulator [Anaerolineae bacterium]|jgi:two-component system cell cycle response regulator DivK|nr:response regulator [Anaerolineae bacterium]
MKSRILYIEDNPQNMDLVCRILSHVGGYEVFGAVDGLSGVEKARHEKPDLIIMDINLPDISGIEATQRIKAQPDLHQIPIIAFTADTGESDRQKYLAAGCDGYMAKPASAQMLLTTVQRYL